MIRFLAANMASQSGPDIGSSVARTRPPNAGISTDESNAADADKRASSIASKLRPHVVNRIPIKSILGKPRAPGFRAALL